jgi:hypothetical protein
MKKTTIEIEFSFVPVVGKIISKGNKRIKVKRNLGDNKYLCEVYTQR